MAKVIQLIYVEAYRGIGTEDNRCRIVEQYWTFEGELLWERDPCPLHTVTFKVPDIYVMPTVDDLESYTEAKRTAAAAFMETAKTFDGA